MTESYDVVICGGGLAGLTLAYQLKREIPGVTVAVVERTCRPLPEAAHKVGESSVELSSHYFGERLALKPYLNANQLHKNGLRFICGDTQGALADRPEIGPAEFPIVPSYQLDRGTFESDLRGMIEESGVSFFEGESVDDADLNMEGGRHTVRLKSGKSLSARWVVDAQGRRKMIQKKFDVQRPSPNRANSTWFRVKERVLVSELVPEDRSDWHQRDVDKNRWLSTVHIMGRGYWVWLIPLSTGYTSVGVVVSMDHHDFLTINTPEKTLAWIAKHEPRVMERIKDLPMEDFCMLHNYSYLTERFIWPERFSCVGEAAAFVDPLYSMGSDFIGMSNSYTTRCIKEDLAGDFDPEVLEELNHIYVRLANDAARTLCKNGDVFPHGTIMAAKLWWDFFNYWSFMCPHFFQNIFQTDVATMKKFRSMQEKFFALNTRAQLTLQAWADLKDEEFSGEKPFIGLPPYPSVIADAHVNLQKELSPTETYAKMEMDLVTGTELVNEILIHALRDLGLSKAAALVTKLGLTENPIPHSRVRADALPRRERVDALPRIGRDMERALGRPECEASLEELLTKAFARAMRSADANL